MKGLNPENVDIWKRVISAIAEKGGKMNVLEVSKRADFNQYAVPTLEGVEKAKGIFDRNPDRLEKMAEAHRGKHLRFIDPVSETIYWIDKDPGEYLSIAIVKKNGLFTGDYFPAFDDARKWVMKDIFEYIKQQGPIDEYFEREVSKSLGIKMRYEVKGEVWEIILVQPVEEEYVLVMMELDDLTGLCGFFYDAAKEDEDCPSHSGYDCRHPACEEGDEGVGACFTFSCPLGARADGQDCKKYGYDCSEREDFCGGKDCSECKHNDGCEDQIGCDNCDLMCYIDLPKRLFNPNFMYMHL